MHKRATLALTIAALTGTAAAENYQSAYYGLMVHDAQFVNEPSIGKLMTDVLTKLGAGQCGATFEPYMLASKAALNTFLRGAKAKNFQSRELLNFSGSVALAGGTRNGSMQLLKLTSKHGALFALSVSGAGSPMVALVICPVG